jgi:inner membrane protein involved in colicin E2 resistance
MDLPNRLNPGPLAARITAFAPVSLLFFLVVMVILGVLQQRNLHPVNYGFLSAAFFAFHLLLAYLVDHVDIHVAFVAASAVSIGLVVSYLRLVSGTAFALARAGLAQLVFLVLFSYAFFFEGYTGLTVTLGAIATLFVLMQVTAHVDWGNVFAGASGVSRATGASVRS